MPKVELHPILKVEIKDCWIDEAGDFTPWLANPNNLQLVSELIDMNLAVIQTEAPAGRYSADILCKDLETGRYVVIENQLTGSDHKHLGQLLTYAAALDATALVWIAESFNPEHKATLEWLNRGTNESIGFFAFEIRMIRVGDKYSLNLDPVVVPNTWAKQIRAVADEASSQSETMTLKHEYWRSFKQYMEGIGQTCPSPSPNVNLNFYFGVGGVKITLIANTQWEARPDDKSQGIRVQLVFEKGENSRLFDALNARKEEIEQGIGFPLDWHQEENVERRRIFVQKNVDIRDRSDWKNQHEWLVNNLSKFQKTIVPILRA